MLTVQNIRKKYKLSIKENEKFWAKEGKEFHGLKNILKSKMLNTVKKKLILNGITTAF